MAERFAFVLSSSKSKASMSSSVTRLPGTALQDQMSSSHHDLISAGITAGLTLMHIQRCSACTSTEQDDSSLVVRPKIDLAVQTPDRHKPFVFQSHFLRRDIVPDGKTGTSVLNSFIRKLIPFASKRRSEVC